MSMQEPKTRSECESGMCPLQGYNSGSNEEIDLAKKTLMRCSMCKNRFYCSTRCQKNDWKVHKWNCSVLPVDGLPAATVVEINDEFKAEVTRVVAILKEVAAAVKDEKKKVSVAMLAPLLAISSELPERLRYTRAIPDGDKFKYRLPIITACRLLLIDHVATLDDAARPEYEKFFAGMANFPMSFPEMYGPKFVGRPADLSPGEYEMIARTMPVWFISKTEAWEQQEENAEVGNLAIEAASEENAGEQKEGELWIWLGIVVKRVYNAE
ncbi:hypothetical protein C8F01DRAFT_1146630 [Mycena amicta]|nr:hypothetical protein C8F01DRAFT_1146630 [Mycena amicta]